MDFLIDFMIQYGYWGMFLAGVIAGSLFPISSEAVMLGLWAAGLNPMWLIIYGSIGNVLGSMLNYALGRMGKMEWLQKWFHLKPEDLKKAEKFMGGHGALMGFFCFLPVIGEGISVILGLTRANVLLSTLSITVGKVLRYIVLIYGIDFFL